MVADGINLTVGGAIRIATGKMYGYMHPDAFRDLMGEEAYQEVIARPRVICEYDHEETNA